MTLLVLALKVLRSQSLLGYISELVTLCILFRKRGSPDLPGWMFSQPYIFPLCVCVNKQTKLTSQALLISWPGMEKSPWQDKTVIVCCVAHRSNYPIPLPVHVNSSSQRHWKCDNYGTSPGRIEESGTERKPVLCFIKSRSDGAALRS